MNIKYAYSKLPLFFFWLMLVIPTAHQIERGFLLGILLIVAIIHSLGKSNWKLNYEIAFIGFITISASTFYILLGLLNEHPAISVGTVYVLWPLLYIFFIGIYYRPENYIPFFKTLIIGCMTSSLIGIFAVLETLGFFDLGFVNFLGSGVRVDVSGKTIAYSMPNLVTVIYSFPFFTAIILLPKKVTTLNSTWVKIAWIGFFLSILVLLFSGRRAFWVIAVLAPFIAMIFFVLCKIRFNLTTLSFFVMLATILIIAITFFIDVSYFWDNFIIGFNFSDPSNVDAYARKEQFIALLNGWYESPLIGSGHGAGAEEYIRSTKEPWSYELSYMSLLFHTGLIGFLIYGCAVTWLFFRSIIIIRRNTEAASMLIPLLIGFLCFLIINISNPYLEKFDYLWTLFLPLAVLNAFLLKHKKKKVSVTNKEFKVYIK
tara:strand:+ start:390 stop:1676 length:1287 start_codon:yes stop_codon:yes gene_type:complete